MINEQTTNLALLAELLQEQSQQPPATDPFNAIDHDGKVIQLTEPDDDGRNIYGSELELGMVLPFVPIKQQAQLKNVHNTHKKLTASFRDKKF